MSPCRNPAVEQFANQECHAARHMEAIDVGAAVRINARQQRHHRRQVAEIIPGDRDAGAARDRHQVQGVIGRAAGRQQADDGIHDGRFVDGVRQRQIFVAQRGDARRAAGRGGRQCVAQGSIGRHERGSRHVQAHDLHQHLIAVGRTVESARARRVIAARLRFEQLVSADLALGVKLAYPRLFLVRHAGWHGTARHENDRQMAEGQRTHQHARNDLVADAETQRRIEHVVRQRNPGRHRDHISAEQRQFHAGLALSHPVAHGGHAARELRDRAGLARRPLDQRRIVLEGLMRRQHVVVCRHDGDIGPAHELERLFIRGARGGKTMRKIGA